MLSFLSSVLSGILLLICGILAAPIMCAIFIALWAVVCILIINAITGVEYVIHLIKENI